jgi:hypothetical protein
LAVFRVAAACGADVGDGADVDDDIGAEFTTGVVPDDPPPLQAARSATALTPSASEILFFMTEPCNEIVKKL